MKEFSQIQKWTRGIPKKSGNLIYGIGDDCAVIRGDSHDILITTDAIVEDIHFRSEWSSWKEVGYKAIATAVSDIGAMGGVPRYLWTTVQISSFLSDREMNDLGKGIQQACRKFGVIWAGGDTVSHPDLVSISVTVWGEVASGTAVLRRGAVPGDLIFVAGSLGEAAAGLWLLQEGKEKKCDLTLLQKQKSPAPLLRVGHWLAKNEFVRAMIDVSDGLMADLKHIASASRCKATVDPKKIPVSPRLRRLQKELDAPVKSFLLSGGEDYALLFAVDPKKSKDLTARFKKQFGKKIPITSIGKFSKGKGVSPKSSGFEHSLGTGSDRMWVVETNVDDMNPEFFDYVMEQLFQAGARDVTLLPLQMKKNRPATQIQCIVPLEKRRKIIEILLRETTSIGVRFYPVQRRIMERKMSFCKTRFGDIPVKWVQDRRLGIQKAVPEYDACRRLAKRKKIPLQTIYQEVLQRTCLK